MTATGFVHGRADCAGLITVRIWFSHTEDESTITWVCRDCQAQEAQTGPRRLGETLLAEIRRRGVEVPVPVVH